MNGRDIVKIETLIQSIRYNFPKIKINYCVNMDHSAFLAVNKKVFFFKGTKELARSIVFLINAKFSSKAIEVLLKEKTTKKKEFFFFWVAHCVNYGHQKGRTLEDLRTEFNNIYGLEIKQGRKKATLLRVEPENGEAVASVEGKPEKAPTECTEQGQIL